MSLHPCKKGPTAVSKDEKRKNELLQLQNILIIVKSFFKASIQQVGL